MSLIRQNHNAEWHKVTDARGDPLVVTIVGPKHKHVLVSR
jgi:hypothetical protein